MNIDSLSIQSLLSSADGLVKLQQTLSLDGPLSQVFSDTLVEKINILNNFSEGKPTTENVTTNMPIGNEKLHEIAAFLNEKQAIPNSMGLLGKELPVFNRFEKNIDLENTLEALANVINTLEDVDLDNKFEAMLEKVEYLKAAIPEQFGMEEKLNKISEELQSIKDVISKFEVLENNTEKLGTAIVKQISLNNETNETNETNEVVVEGKLPQVEQFKKEHVDDKLTENNLPISNNLPEQIDSVVNAIEEIKKRVLNNSPLSKGTDLDVQIELLATEVESIKDTFVQNKTEELTAKIDQEQGVKPDIVTDQPQLEVHEEDDTILVADQIAAIIATLNEPQRQEKMVVAASLSELKPDQVKESLFVINKAEEKSFGITAKAEPETLLQHDNVPRKQENENPVIEVKRDDKKDFLSEKTIEPNNDKVLPRFATDIAMLNKAVLVENKAEIPAMTKHFAHPEWNKEMGERVIWMHKQEIPSAELRLNPKHLGPITIKVNVSQDQTTVTFNVQHAAVKEAIEAALPKLREMFSAQQLNLAEVNVSQENSGQRQPRNFSQMGSEAGERGNGKDMADNEHADRVMEIADEIEAGRAIASSGILSIFA